MLLAKLSILLTFLILFTVLPALAVKKSYIVYLGAHSHGPEVTAADLLRVKDSHYQLLGSFLGSKAEAKDAIFYSYKREINGFAAMLEDEEAAALAGHPDVLSVFPNKGRKLHTTHSWDFLMLENDGVIHRGSIWEKANFGGDTIIGNLDTGVWSASQSFYDQGYGPIPSKWKGVCQRGSGSRVTCNRKLIGARYFNKGYAAYVGKLNESMDPALDHDGHGTHTLSTAGGNFVPGAAVFGLGNGTARGGSPRARVAAYKVCWPPVNGSECFDADILAAFDRAIHDGVDVLSVSLGGEASDYFDDGIAIGAFHATKKGVVVVCSAGNSGPTPGSVSNVAPWIITVGASTMDREFQAYIKLKNGKSLKGMSLSMPMRDEKFYPLLTAAQGKAINASAKDASLCKPGTLDPNKVKGKILVCLRGENARVDKGEQALLAGAVGMILCNDEASGNEVLSDPHVLPATQVNYTDGVLVFKYINSTKNPRGYITSPRSQLNTKPAPFMASFSSRGPNTVTPEILKPDVTAPGVNIIAAFTEATSPTDVPFDKRRTAFNTESGTSMSCPHIAGIAGLLKTLHPDWSPAAIRSAIMTTARTRDNTGHPMLDATYKMATPFGFGSGQVRPNRVQDPGLVYDLTTNDYLNFLCSLGYNQTQINLFSEASDFACSWGVDLLSFNNPSVTVPNLAYGSEITISRTVKNVGTPGTYSARIRHPRGVTVIVKPKVLHFERTGEEKSFKLILKAKRDVEVEETAFGELIWSDGLHYVRSPIVVNSRSDE